MAGLFQGGVYLTAGLASSRQIDDDLAIFTVLVGLMAVAVVV